MENEKKYILPEQVDKLLNLPQGRCARLVRRGLIPAIVLPDGTIRLAPDVLDHFKRGCAAVVQ